MDFSHSVEYLLTLGNEVSAMKLGLENIRTLLAALGDPHEKYLKVQVAGTNGKGSVCAFLDSICNEAGIRTGTYTSPHLISITERVRINGVDIHEDEFARIANLVRETSEKLLAEKHLEYRPTFFEQITAIALFAFAEAKVELAIIETGLGGRLDATTAANAEIAAITRIDLDHQEYLGETIEEIAAEKASIIGPQTKTVVIGPQDPRALGVAKARIRGFSATPLQVRFAEKTKIQIGLAGRYQAENAGIALELAQLLTSHFSIADHQIKAGLAKAKHSGRLEYIGSRYLLDGAHNPLGAAALREFLDEFEARPITIIFGAMQGKDLSAMATALFPRAVTLVMTVPRNSRAMKTDDLISNIPPAMNIKGVISTNNVAEALAEAERRTNSQGLIVITGSLYLVGEARRLLFEKLTLEI